MRIVVPIGLTFILSLLFSYNACACPAVVETVVVKCDIDDSLFEQNNTCLNDICSVNTSIDRDGYLSLNFLDPKFRGHVDERGGVRIYSHYDLDNLAIYPGIISTLDTICTDSISDLKPVFGQEIQYWVSNRKRASLGWELVFEPYSPHRVSEMSKEQKDLGKCRYEDFKRFGSWLVVSERTREYCPPTGLCGAPEISHLKFMGFLLTHPSPHTLPYLAIYLPPVAALFVFCLYFFRRKELWLFFKPNRFNVIFTVILIFPHLYFFGSSNFEGLIILYYLLGSLITYAYYRVKKTR